jgi:hypothetical protein
LAIHFPGDPAQAQAPSVKLWYVVYSPHSALATLLASALNRQQKHRRAGQRQHRCAR